MPEPICTLELFRSEVEHLAQWYRECEERLAGMREYGMAEKKKERGVLFEALLKSGNRVWKEPTK